MLVSYLHGIFLFCQNLSKSKQLEVAMDKYEQIVFNSQHLLSDFYGDLWKDTWQRQVEHMAPRRTLRLKEIWKKDEAPQLPSLSPSLNCSPSNPMFASITVPQKLARPVLTSYLVAFPIAEHSFFVFYFNRGQRSASSNPSVALQRKSTSVSAGTFCSCEWDGKDSLYWTLLLEHSVY